MIDVFYLYQFTRFGWGGVFTAHTVRLVFKYSERYLDAFFKGAIMGFLIWVGLSILIGVWAARWNRNGGLWGFVSLIISPLIGAIALLIVGNGGETCPQCAEIVKMEAKVCKHCGFNLEKPRLEREFKRDRSLDLVIKFCVIDFSDGKRIQTSFDTRVEAYSFWDQNKSKFKEASLIKLAPAIFDKDKNEYVGRSELLERIEQGKV